MFGAETNELSGAPDKLQKEELQDLCSSLHTVRLFWSDEVDH
jgi:hypothetical protein